MDIIIPRIRDQKKWKENESKAKVFIQKKFPLNFQEYCQLSLYCIDADENNILKIFGGKLKSPSISYNINNSSKQQDKKQEEQQKNIIKILTYAWENIINLINGKQQNKQSHLGIYTDDNINIHLARLEEMLLQLKGKKYRCAVYLREHAYSREIAEKQLSQQLIFIKLLQNILKTQTTKIKEMRVRKDIKRENKREQIEEIEEVVEKLDPISQIINVKDYFQRKYAHKDDNNKVKDAIDQQQQKRRFNSAVIRYHLQNSQRR